MTTKLLAVDDSKTMRKVLEITFAGDTYDSTIVGSADEALGVVRSGAPQVAVIDAHLGSSSGYDLCRQIKEVAPGTKVILLSSKQRPYDEAAGSGAGVDDHFDKPFDSSKFLTKVDEIAQTAGAPAASAPAASAPAAVPSRAAAPIAAQAPAKAPEAPAPLAASPSPPRASVMQRPQAPPPRVASAAPVAEGRPASRAASPPVATLTALKGSGMEDKLHAMGLTSDQVKGVLTLSREVVEQVVWEVVPALAETLIKEEIARLTSE